MVKNNIESILEKTPSQPSVKANRASKLKDGAKRASIFGGSAAAIGVFDAFHPRSVFTTIQGAGSWLGRYLPAALSFIIPIPTQLYQTGLVVADAGGTAAALYNKNWSKGRNLSSLVATPANAVTMDYASASMSAGTPVYPLPAIDYGWRIDAFKHTAWGGLAQLINTPSFIPGIITGYILGIASLGAYFAVQAGIWLHKNAEKVKAWAQKAGNYIRHGLYRVLTPVKSSIKEGYTFLLDKLKSGYRYTSKELKAAYKYAADKIGGFTHDLLQEIPSSLTVTPTETHFSGTTPVAIAA